MKKLVHGIAESQLKGYECYIQYSIPKLKTIKIKNQ